MKRIGIFFSIAALLVIIFFSCSKSSSSNNGGGTSNNNGKDSILVNLGNNIIIPNYQLLSTTANSLDSAIDDFNQSPDANKLSDLQSIFKNAYIAFQSATEFEFGPDDPKTLLSLNLFPAAAARIDSNIAAGNYSINTFANTSAKGFPALDYLLFGVNNSTLLIDYTSEAQAASRKQYLAAVSADIKTTANNILAKWLATGSNYINTFINGTGTSIGSSLGELINSMDQDYETLKNYRLGLPLGKQSLDTLKPNEVEAYYSGISSQLALAQLKTVQSIYLGTGTHGNGLGLSKYVIKANAQYNGSSLDDAIKTQFTNAITKLQAVADPLSATIQNSTAAVNAAYTEVQKLLVMLKTDMPSALGVLITYADNDGD